MDDNGHGTALAGVMCAKDDDSGIVGINPNMELYSVKALDANNQSPLSRIIEGIYWGIKHDVDIINMSFGTTKDSEILHQAVRDAAKHGIMMVAAAGNTMHKEVQYPAAYSEVVAVGSVGTDGKLAEETSVGTSLELLAPGEAIITNGFYSIPVVAEGTSIATAQVTGVASLLYGRTQKNQSAVVRGVLSASAKQVPVPDGVTAGMIDYNCAEEIFDDYEKAYQDNGQEEYDYQHDCKIEDYTEIAEEQVQGLWSKDDHQYMVAAAFSAYSTEQMLIVRAAASKPDDSSIKDGAAAELHGAGNYVAHLKYLWYLSVFLGKETTDGTSAGITNAIINARKNAKEKLAGTTVATSGSAGNFRYQHLAENSGTLIRASLENVDLKSVDAKRLQLIVWGYISHLIGDVYAHRAVIPPSTKANYGSTFVENQFLVSHFQNFNEFLSEYKNETMEYRWIKGYCNNSTIRNNYYIDSSTFFENRIKNAKQCVRKLIKHGKDNQGVFSMDTILPSEYPQNSKLAYLDKYCKQSGVSTAEVKASYTAETKEPPEIKEGQ